MNAPTIVSMYAERAVSVAAVACTWSQRPGPTGHVQRVVPDGCVDIVVSGEEAFVAGPDTRPWLADLPAAAGVSLRARELPQAHAMVSRRAVVRSVVKTPRHGA